MSSPEILCKEIVASIKEIRRGSRKSFSKEEAQNIYNQMNLVETKYDPEEFWLGLNVELEHGTKGDWNITNNDAIMTAKIALAHMDESPTYYKDLKKYVEK